MTGSPAHDKLYQYDNVGALLDHVAPFLAEGVAEHEPVVLVVDPRKPALRGATVIHSAVVILAAPR